MELAAERVELINNKEFDYEIAMQNFLESIKTKVTRKNYTYALDTFFDFLQIRENKNEISLLLKKILKRLKKV
jgi:hypothetical protein